MAIAITIKPQHLCNICNGIKDGEVRKNKALINAVKKEIAEKGKATIYCVCSKGGKGLTMSINGYRLAYNNKLGRVFNGKVVCKFECEKVEDIIAKQYQGMTYFETESMNELTLLSYLRLSFCELEKYLRTKDNKLGLNNVHRGAFIHISNLKIFDKPKELKELKHWTKKWIDCGMDCPPYVDDVLVPLTKAPQNFCYVEDTL